ncbi:YhbD family protein [Paenibacillus sepulcri]|uniref:YhbD family protein n=1 Tax=Paenibacillus sepulcri TaxID=359917 RepID=A0ABS7C5H4_9BACL|nr:YhbD family protein [Paenibacillus sepulcri]
MERELISKKELLELTGISYGQLYRWKRKQLIPEEWFIRKAVFTGQETFFPRDLILPRIEKILHLKDDVSLDELVGKLSPELNDIRISKGDCWKRNIVSELVIRRFAGDSPENTLLSFQSLLFLFIADKLLQTGEMSLEEGALLLPTLEEHFKAFEDKGCDVVFIRKMGVAIFLLLGRSEKIGFDRGVKQVLRLSVTDCIEELRMKLT